MTGVKQTVIKKPSWWKRRSSMERCLTLTSLIVSLIGLALLISLLFVVYKSKKTDDTSQNGPEALLSFSNEGYQAPNTLTATTENKKRVCLTPGCIHAASSVLKHMDPSVDPCDDFYQFTCGNFVKSTIIPDDKSSVSSFSVISDKLTEQLRSVIDQPIEENEPFPFKITKKLYKACMNKTLIEKSSLATIKELLAELGNWPVIIGDSWDEGKFDWRESVYRFKKVGYSVDYYIDFSVSHDLKNTTKRIIDLDQASFGLRREFLIKGLNDSLVKAYYDYMVDIAVILGADRSRAEKELMKSLEFETKLANISLPSEKRRNATLLYNLMTISDLETKYPSIPWLTYINTLLAPDNKVFENETLLVAVPQYLREFEILIARTPKRTQANYVMWRAMSSSVSYLGEDFRRRQLEYTTVVTGRTERASRWKECVDIAAGSMSTAAGALYVRKYFKENAKQRAMEMVKDIREEFHTILNQVDWMDNKTRQHALEKAEAMATHIGYPDELLDDKKLEEFYEGLEVDENQYLKSVLNLTKFGTRYSFRRLRQPVNKTDWISHGRPSVVNAFYSALENSIQFPAGILQGVFFNADRPQYMNYGAIGFVIGHEITHGFDDQGRQFDKQGNLVNWWDPQTQEAFNQKAQCIIDQYNNFTVPELGIKMNGFKTLGENIADSGGLKISHQAFRRWELRHGREEARLPGLVQYNPRQLFWMSSAMVWCSSMRIEEMKQLVLVDSHPPDKYRVLIPLMNNKLFSKDWGCDARKKMNPKKKCGVW